MTTVQVGPTLGGNNPRLPDMEIAGYSIVSASLPTEDLVEQVKQSLHSKPKVSRGSLQYGRGDQAACGKLLRWGADHNNAVCLLLKHSNSN